MNNYIAFYDSLIYKKIDYHQNYSPKALARYSHYMLCIMACIYLKIPTIFLAKTLLIILENPF